jgi:very-short-patch-repair endonuclease
MWGFVRGGRSRTVDVIIRPGGGTRRPGIATHRPDGLEPDETTVFDGVPITTSGRTLYDVALITRPKALERAVSEALACGRITPEDLAAVGQRYAGRPGGRRLVEALGEDGPRFTRSEAEARFLRLLRRSGLPPPLVNEVVLGYEVDFHWPTERLVVEVDGFAYHGSRRSFEGDRARDADLSRSGLRVVRVTWRQLVREPLLLAARMGALLSTPGDGWPGH